MKRTVKAWAWVWHSGHLNLYCYSRKRDVVEWHRGDVKFGRAVPCTITYDDSKPPKRTRRGK